MPQAAGQIRFGPGGRRLACMIASQGADELWSLPLAGGDARRLLGSGSERIGDFAWSPDGTRLSVVKFAESRDVVLLNRGTS